MLSTQQRRLEGVPIRTVPDGNCFALRSDRDLSSVVDKHREAIVSTIERDGWALLRGLDIRTPTQFADCMRALGVTPVEHYSDLPLLGCHSYIGSAGSSKDASIVLGVTPVPSEEAILFHHEGAHTATPCEWISFHCAQAARHGGQTPFADGAMLWARLPTEMQSHFSSHKLAYERRFISGLDVAWQYFFRTYDQNEALDRCAHNGIEAYFEPDGVLYTRIERPAIEIHEGLGQPVFFNQLLLHHPVCLDSEVRQALSFGSCSPHMPREVYFADGSQIPYEWVTLIVQTYIELAIAFNWSDGDVLVLDNFRMAHARCPYAGPRRHHAILGTPRTY